MQNGRSYSLFKDQGSVLSDLLPYILHIEVVCARLISISSERLCFQCMMSVPRRASSSLLACMPCFAPCWTRDCMPRDAKYCKTQQGVLII